MIPQLLMTVAIYDDEIHFHDKEDVNEEIVEHADNRDNDINGLMC